MKNRNLSLKFLLICGLFTFSNAFSQDYEAIIKNHIADKEAKSFSKSDLKNFDISNKDFSKSLNSDVIKIQQTYNGLPVYNSVATALIQNSEVKNYTENFVKSYGTSVSAKASLSASNVFAKVAQQFNLKASDFIIAEIGDKEDDRNAYAKKRLVYFKKGEDLVLCYEFFFEEKGTSNYWNILADANSGTIVNQENLTVSCNFEHDAYSHSFTDHLPEMLKQNTNSENTLSSVAAPGVASYNVFALPLEGPSFGARTIVSNPWLIDASPEGWHSTGTAAYNSTRGNNVYAYSDRNNNNTVQDVPDGGASRVFDFSYSALGSANSNLSAATTNLFYMNNKMHDILYRFGFTETARNFQASNFGKGGEENDYIRAESQDGGGTNNANFATPIDGGTPRMQMYLWDSNLVPTKRIYFNSPPEAVSRLTNSFGASFGPALDTTGVTGNIKVASVLNGCSALPANSMTENIALMVRGTCGFAVKVKNAQVAGAVGAIIYNAVDSSTFGTMGGTDATVTIPSVLIENSEGEYIKSLLANATPVNVTLKFDKYEANYLDGSFDNGIVAHEYGHGISNRNTGDGYTCLSYNSSNEQMGEGWSDFFALMLTNQPNATAAVSRGIGTYASGEATNGGGIRPKKYSPDFAVNDVTYAYTNGKTTLNQYGVTVPHSHTIGYVWATMLWDLHWNFANRYGYASDVAANPTSGSGKVLQLVMDGLKLQICSPTFIDGRNAILAADAAKGGTDKCMIWNTFAKRGLGVNASAGAKTGVTTGLNDQVENFEVPAECLALATDETSKDKVVSIYPNPATNEFFVKVPSQQLGKLSVEVYDASGRIVTTEKVSGSESISTSKLVNGVYIVKVKGLGVESSTKLVIKK